MPDFYAFHAFVLACEVSALTPPPLWLTSLTAFPKTPLAVSMSTPPALIATDAAVISRPSFGAMTMSARASSFSSRRQPSQSHNAPRLLRTAHPIRSATRKTHHKSGINGTRLWLLIDSEATGAVTRKAAPLHEQNPLIHGRGVAFGLDRRANRGWSSLRLPPL